MSVTLPPLRRRPSEVVPLAVYILKAESARAGRRYVALTREAEEALLQHAWPGNVRELKNVITRALFLSQGEPIRARHLVMNDPGAEIRDPGIESPSEEAIAAASPSRPTLAPMPSFYARGGEDEEKAAIVAALEKCGGNQSRAAKMLGISRRKLLNRLDHFKLPRPHKQVEDAGED